MAKILVLHGPNLNLLGSREPETYGNVSLSDINSQLSEQAAEFGHQLTHFQSNSESALIERIQQTQSDDTNIVIINPAAFTHTSVALRDALLATQIPFFEVHISNVFAREPFRQHSYFSDIAIGMISGFGIQGYLFALQAAHQFLTEGHPHGS